MGARGAEINRLQKELRVRMYFEFFVRIHTVSTDIYFSRYNSMYTGADCLQRREYSWNAVFTSEECSCNAVSAY